MFTAGRSFGYDNLNRLIAATGTFAASQAPANCGYTFSPIGNLTDKCGAVLSYGDANHPSAVTNHAGTGKSYTYDANGNMLTRGSQTLLWDVDNRVTSITSSGQTTYHEYDYTGMRVKKNAPAGITLFPFQGYEIDPGNTITKFIRIGHETYASKRGASKLYYHNDHLGSVNVITNEAGTRVQLNEYDPWGGVSRSEGNIDPTHRFTGKELDPESGLYYYGGRYYDHELGRFISADPFIQAPYDPQNLNRYSYVLNNPQNLIDPTGYFHKVKKQGGFFRSPFGIFLRVVGSIVLIWAGVPAAGADFGLSSAASIASGLSGLGSAIADIASGQGGGGTTSFASNGSELAAVIGRGFFSPALLMPGEAGCDECSDWRLDLLQVLIGFFRIAEAEAGDNDSGRVPPSAIIDKLIKNKGKGGAATPKGGETPKQPSQPMTRAQAREAAKDLGYKEVKDAPFNSHGQPVFQKGNRYITPDIDSHRGGTWKLFDNKGNRLGTYNGNLTVRLGD